MEQQATRIRPADLYHLRTLPGGDPGLAIVCERRGAATVALDEGDVWGFVEW